MIFPLLIAAGIGALVHNTFWLHDRLREQHERIKQLEEKQGTPAPAAK